MKRKPRPKPPAVIWVGICDNGHALCATADSKDRRSVGGSRWRFGNRVFVNTCEKCPPGVPKRAVKYVLPS